jgi:hypothetical protein
MRLSNACRNNIFDTEDENTKLTLNNGRATITVIDIGKPDHPHKEIYLESYYTNIEDFTADVANLGFEPAIVKLMNYGRKV